MQQGLAWLADQLKRNAGQQVTYQRGGQSVVATATLGQTAFRLEDLVRGATKLEHSAADFAFTAADLAFGGVTVVPERGDVVLWTFAGVTRRFEVGSVPGERPWKLDAYGIMVTVHTKYAGNA